MSKRNSFVTAGLGLLSPGLGHLYLARPGRFLIAAAIVALIIISLGLIGVLSSLYGAITYVALNVFLVLFSVVDSFVIARKKEVVLNGYNRWYVYVMWIFLIIALFVLQIAIRESLLGFGVYRIKMASAPTVIQQNGWIVVDTHAFRDHGPAVGETVLVRQNEGGSVHGKLYGKVYIGRVTGRPSESAFSYVVGSEGVEQQNIPINALVGRPTTAFSLNDIARYMNAVSRD